MLSQLSHRNPCFENPAPSNTTLTSLHQSSFFAGIPEEAVADCAAQFTVLRVNRRSDVFRQGDPCSQIYCVLRGLVRVGRLTKDGEDFTVYVAGRGDLFGDESLFLDAFHLEFATALEDCIIGACRADYIKALVMRYPLLGINVAQSFRERHNGALKRIQRMQFSRAGDHLLQLLHELAVRRGTSPVGDARVELPLTHAELASLIGTTRETVSIELRNLASKGFVLRRGRKIVVRLLPGGES